MKTWMNEYDVYRRSGWNAAVEGYTLRFVVC